MREPEASFETDDPDSIELKFKNLSAELAAVLVVTVGIGLLRLPARAFAQMPAPCRRPPPENPGGPKA